MKRRQQLSAPPRNWDRGPAPTKRARCYRTKSQALRVFADRNRDLIDRWGGLSIKASPAEFDSINAKYGLRGKRAVRTLEQALFAVLPNSCLDRMDIDALNATSPASSGRFELPDHVHDIATRMEERRRHAEQKRAAAEQRRRDQAEASALFGSKKDSS